MSKEIENKVASTKKEQKGMLSGALLKLVLSGHNKSPEEFAQKVVDLGSSMLDFMKAVDLMAADMKIAAEEGIVLNEKGEAVMMVPVKKEKPIKKVTVTHKNIGDLWDKIQGEIDNFVRCYPDGLQTDKVLKENIGTMLGKFVDDNRL